MTICLAALCDDGDSCVVAADRMAVFGAGSLLEFKQDDNSNKIYTLSDDSVLLHSGSNQDALAIVEKMRLNDNAPIRDRLDHVLAELLTEKRNLQVSRLIGGDYDYKKLMTAVATAPVGPFNDVWQEVRKLDLGDMLLVAPDEGKFGIHWLRPPVFAMKSDLHYSSNAHEITSPFVITL